MWITNSSIRTQNYVSSMSNKNIMGIVRISMVISGVTGRDGLLSLILVPNTLDLRSICEAIFYMLPIRILTF